MSTFIEDLYARRWDGIPFSGDRLSAVETINDAKTHMQARKYLAGLRTNPDQHVKSNKQSIVSREDLIATGLDLAAL